MPTALRLLPLPLCIALSLSAHAADERPEDWRLCPIQDAVPAFADAQEPVGTLAQRPSQPTDIEGDTVAGVDGQTTTFDGNVSLKRGDQFLGTDRLVYDSQTGRYVAEGSVRYQDSGMRLVAKRAEGDQNIDSHKLEDVRYQLMSRRGSGGAERIEMHGSQGVLHGSTYSTCPPDDRRWELRAQQIDVDTAEGMGVARNATLRIGKVPVLYVPWLMFPIDDRRRTGLLYPSIGTSNRNGFDWKQPIYLNLAPNYDMTLTPRLMSARGLMLGTEFRYLTENGRGTFEAAVLPSDKLTERGRAQEIAEGVPPENRRDSDRSKFRFTGEQNLSPQWQARADLNWISDPRYLEDFSSSLDGISSYWMNSSAGVFGRGRTWSAGISGSHWQLADHTLSEGLLPYHQLPRAFARWDQPFGRWFTAGIDSEAVRFAHEVRDGGSRIDVKPYISMPLEGASWFLKPTLAWRYTGYQLDDGLARQIAVERGSAFPESSPSRSLPIASVDAGLFLDRETSWNGNSYLHTLEPRLFYLKAPYRDQSGLPLFDTQPLTFSWGQLFRDNRYSGGDRQTDANQLTMALTTRLIRQSDGREKLSASIGQIRYFDDVRVTIPGETVVERGKSAWIAGATYAPNDRWTINAAYQWDPKFRRQDLASLHTRYLVGDEGIVNFGYRYRRSLLEQVDLSFLYPLNPSWSVVGRYYYSLYRDPIQRIEPGLLEGILGVQWDSCCLAVRLVGRRYLRNRSGELNNAIQLEIELKGLGSAGPDTESRLRRAILGYRREDLYLVPPLDVRGQDDNSPDPTP